ncbi:MAG: AraC family transcriptional regulator ligand-binding domain-containing protein [Actinomycetota bacterium]
MDDSYRTIHDTGTAPASLMTALVLFARNVGVSTEAIAEATGITIPQLVDQDRRLPVKIVPVLWNLMRELRPGEPLPMQAAAALPSSAVGPLVNAVRFASTQREAIETCIRYSRLLGDGLTLGLHEPGSHPELGAGEAALEMSHPFDAEDNGASAEFGIALSARFMGLTSREPASWMRRIEFAFPAGAPLADYQRYLGVDDVRFSTPWSAIVFRASMLDDPAESPDAELYVYVEEHLRAAAAELAPLADATDDPLLHDVVELVAQGEYDIDRLASQLHLTTRTLQRRLRAHGTTPSAIVQQARRAAAVELLSDRSLSVEQAAFSLGYFDERSFRRAVKRWTGSTPAELRRQLV